MIKIFRDAGRMTGKLMNSPTVEKAYKTASEYVSAGFEAAKSAARLAAAKQKFESHLLILGRNVYRLVSNGEDPSHNKQVNALVSTLKEIENEIASLERKTDDRQ